MISYLLLKPQVPAFTVPQRSEAMDVLSERANELMVMCMFLLILSGVIALLHELKVSLTFTSHYFSEQDFVNTSCKRLCKELLICFLCLFFVMW